jgi:3-dehydroquinate dehydratase
MICAEKDYEQQSAPCSTYADLVTEAEREMTAYLIAVKEIHGPHSVNIAAEHWIQALNEICLSNLKSKESFRRVTFSAVSTLCH